MTFRNQTRPNRKQRTFKLKKFNMNFLKFGIIFGLIRGKMLPVSDLRWAKAAYRRNINELQLKSGAILIF